MRVFCYLNCKCADQTNNVCCKNVRQAEATNSKKSRYDRGRLEMPMDMTLKLRGCHWFGAIHIFGGAFAKW